MPPARPGLRIERDSWGVAHVFGATRGDVMYGAGWVTVADRAPLMELLRGPGRLAAVDAPGIDPLQILLTSGVRSESQTEAFLAQQIALWQARDRPGSRSCRTSTTISRESTTPVPLRRCRPPWTRNDVVAVTAVWRGVWRGRW